MGSAWVGSSRVGVAGHIGGPDTIWQGGSGGLDAVWHAEGNDGLWLDSVRRWERVEAGLQWHGSSRGWESARRACRRGWKGRACAEVACRTVGQGLPRTGVSQGMGWLEATRLGSPHGSARLHSAWLVPGNGLTRVDRAWLVAWTGVEGHAWGGLSEGMVWLVTAARMGTAGCDQRGNVSAARAGACRCTWRELAWLDPVWQG